jgi:hypothetical protein
MPLYIKFEILGSITNRRTIAVGNRIRELQRLVDTYGSGRWRKMSGEALIRLSDGEIVYAEIHWYEAHGIGMKDFGFKRRLESQD